MKNVGIAIPIFNEQDSIQNLLESIYKQDYPKNNLAVYIADNASTDNSLGVIKHFSKSHQDLSISVSLQQIHGIAPTRLCAMKNALQGNPEYILTVDADTILPPTTLLRSFKRLSNKSESVLAYRLTFPKRFLLVVYIYYQPLKIAITQISTLLDHLLGPSVFTGCLLLPTSVYQRIYWNDMLHPLIPDDDFLLSRHLHALGVPIIRSSIEVPTSDRRFWGNPDNWINHIHTKDYRNQNIQQLHPPTNLKIAQAISSRITKTSERILQSLTEYIFLASLSDRGYIRAETLALRIIHELHLPHNIFKIINESNKQTSYNNLHKQYFQYTKQFVSSYVQKNT